MTDTELNEGTLPGAPELCKHLLDATLRAAHLPVPVDARLRVEFAARVFDPAELERRVAEARMLVAEAQAGAAVQGLSPAAQGRISAVFSAEDRITAALHDLMQVERPQPLRAANPERLSGIREFYQRATGDATFMGGYHPDRAQFSVTSDLPGLLADVLNKKSAGIWQDLQDSPLNWWRKIATVQHFDNLHDIHGVLLGEISTLPVVAEGDPYTELALTDSSETGKFEKMGGFVGITVEMFRRDETHKLLEIPRKLVTSGLRGISARVGGLFTANSGTGAVMTDTYALFNAAHHHNLGTTALSGDAWEAASRAIYEQPLLVAAGGSAPKQALDARYLLVPRALRLEAARILYPGLTYEANINSENMQRGAWGDVIVCPEFTNATDWAAVADPRLAPAIYIGECFGLLPEIFVADDGRSGALFTNDQVRIKARHMLSFFVADHRPLYKANVG